MLYNRKTVTSVYVPILLVDDFYLMYQTQVINYIIPPLSHSIHSSLLKAGGAFKLSTVKLAAFMRQKYTFFLKKITKRICL